jgi:FAD:protein FMN transferase
MAPRLRIDRRTLCVMAIAFLLLTALTWHRLFLARPVDSRGESGVDALILQGEAMGSTWSVRISGSGLDEALRTRAEAEIRKRLDEIDLWFSTWRPDSEISRFNAHRSSEPFGVSPQTAELVADSIALCRASGGAFDITIGPLVARWGFGAHAELAGPPPQAEIDALLARTGADAVTVEDGAAGGAVRLRKRDADVGLDLSAIAPGYAADHIARGLEALGRRDFLVEVGGEIYASGSRPGGGPWNVAIEAPLDDERRIHAMVTISNQGLATSGDYRAFYVEDGHRISHTIDPRSGHPIDNGMASATTIAPSAAAADGWATAVMVLGPKEGLARAAEHGIAVMALVRSASGAFEEQRNALFPRTVRPGDRGQIDLDRSRAGRSIQE